LKSTEFSELKNLDINTEMLLIPVRDHFVRITADHDHFNMKFLYEGPFIWSVGAPTDVRTDTVISQGLIFIADTRRFLITVFDDRGNRLRTIDKSREVEEIPDRALLHQYCVSDGKIYAATYKKKEGRTEMLMFDLDGRILRRLYLTLTSLRPERGCLRYDLFTVDRDILYELVQDQETGRWQLLITHLKQTT
jgi:hypothetical protein